MRTDFECFSLVSKCGRSIRYHQIAPPQKSKWASSKGVVNLENRSCLTGILLEVTSTAYRTASTTKMLNRCCCFSSTKTMTRTHLSDWWLINFSDFYLFGIFLLKCYCNLIRSIRMIACRVLTIEWFENPLITSKNLFLCSKSELPIKVRSITCAEKLEAFSSRSNYW